MLEIFLRIQEEGGNLNPYDPQTARAFNDIKIEDIRKEVLEEAGLNTLNEPGMKIFQHAVQKFSADPT